MISKSDAAWLLKRAMEQGMTYTDGVYKNHQMVTMNGNGYRVIPINAGAGITVELAYNKQFSWLGSPEDLEKISNGI